MMAAVSAPLRAPLSETHLASDGDKLLERFRNIAINGRDAQDVTEAEIKEAFEQELRQLGGRDALDALLQHISLTCARCWKLAIPMKGSISFSSTGANFSFHRVQDIGIQYAIFGRFRGLLSGLGSARYPLEYTQAFYYLFNSSGMFH
jgi:hypothetical protein